MEQLSFTDPEARARATDPETSQAAARSVRDLHASQARVLDVLLRHGPMTDEDTYRTIRREQYMSPSGARTRRSELVSRGLVRDTGQRRKLESGRQAVVWEAV